jgi:hypothetical protein
LGFGFYFSKNPAFGWVLGFFKIKKNWKFSGKIVMKEEKKSKKIIQFFKLIAKHWAAMAGKPLVPPKTNQNL